MKRLFTLLVLLAVAASCRERQVVIEDFESGNLDSWVVEGNAFVFCPKSGSDNPDVSGVKGNFFAASDFGEADASATFFGKMTSRSFVISKDYISFLIGGTGEGFAGRFVAMELLVDGKPVRSARPHGTDPNAMDWNSWDVRDLKGENANIRIRVDSLPSRMRIPLSRYILADQIIQSRKKMGTFNDMLTIPVTAREDYLLIPSSNSGSSSSLSILADGQNILGVAQNIVLAKDVKDYDIPVDISAWKGKTLEVVLTNVDDNDVTVKGLTQSDTRIEQYEEPYRPVYHFSPDFGWTNDPNGMVYFDGEYHLAYQANPYGTRHSNMHWGNAVSTDLIHWEDLPFIVAPDALGAIFSGSSVVDADNTAGFGANAIVGMYTSAGQGQRQSIAYSTDRGRTFTKYEGNPVLDDAEKQPNFRDPKVLRYGDKWVVCVAAGDVIAFYESADLKNWRKLSEFGRGIGSHAAVWECPDLLRFEVGGKEKWVLIVNINPGGPNGGSVGQYFIGNFDGERFVADPLPYPLWIDEGVDNYAGVTFSGTGDRHIFMGWMSNWLYSGSTPTLRFRNAMTLPRDLSLKHNGKHLFLASSPSPEVYAARVSSRTVDASLRNGRISVPEILPDNDGAYEIDFTVAPGKSPLSLRLYNGKGEEMLFTFDFKALTLTLDRSRSGVVDFHKDFAKKDILTHLVKRPEYKVQLFVDRHSTEMFIGDGDVCFTNCMYPTEVYNALELAGADAGISDLTIFNLK
ncbi:MAG: DUF4980 domain-containing protein [Bacteroidales bacterium]|nr:DUF4980 domain-containing protein [Bacteroidales bacterium]